MNIVITGTSRGIGLELCRQASSHKVLAIARRPDDSAELKAAGVQTLKVDLTGAQAPNEIAKALADWPHVDVLINNAGVYLPDKTAEDFLNSFHVNSVVPYFVTQALLPWLRKSKQPKAVHITSQMGSITDNSSGGSYSYRASKAALNMINKSLSVDNPWLTTIVVHPGWVQTDMGGKGAPTPTSESAKGILALIETLKAKNSGQFFDYRGENLPW